MARMIPHPHSFPLQLLLGKISQDSHPGERVVTQFLSLTKNVLHILLIYQIIHVLTNHWEVNFSAIKGTTATIKPSTTVILNLVIKKQKNPLVF